MQQPFAKAGKGGAGCYGISKSALEEIGEFPMIIGDDIWIHTRFSDEQKQLVEASSTGELVFSTVRPPRTAWLQVQVESRRMIGNAQVKRDHPSPYFASVNKGGGFLGSLRSGASPVDLLVFYCVKAMVRIMTKLKGQEDRREIWTRDLSTRQG